MFENKLTHNDNQFCTLDDRINSSYCVKKHVCLHVRVLVCIPVKLNISYSPFLGPSGCEVAHVVFLLFGRSPPTASQARRQQSPIRPPNTSRQLPQLFFQRIAPTIWNKKPLITEKRRARNTDNNTYLITQHTHTIQHNTRIQTYNQRQVINDDQKQTVASIATTRAKQLTSQNNLTPYNKTSPHNLQTTPAKLLNTRVTTCPTKHDSVL